MAESRRKVLLVGWDAADWKAIQPLLDAGKMPALQRLIDRGVRGRIATLRPILSPMLWTSIATGVRPYRHGVHGFTEPDPDTGGVRPISSTSRKVKAVWNILNQNGLRSNVLGWWPSHPAEPLNGVMVSNHYQRAPEDPKKPWPVRPGSIHPDRLIDPLRKLRLHPKELDAEHVLPFIPRGAEIDQKKDPRMRNLMRIIADCTTVHAAATAVMQLEPWDFMAVYYDAIDHFGHGFMRYHPPRQPQISQRDFDLYSGIIEAGYRYHDMMLGSLLQLAGPDTTVILMSDHGFHPDHLRPAHIPFEPAGPAVEHSPYGILVVAGPGIRQGERIHGATLLDIAPTVLTLFGLPVGQDMQGKPLVNAFQQAPDIQTILSWELVAGDHGMHGEEQRLDPDEARESLKQLIDLGYIEDPGENVEKAVANCRRELDYNLAQAYMDDQHYAEAAALLDRLWREWPDELRFANRLVTCWYALRRIDELRRVIDELLTARQRLAGEYRDRVKQMREKVKEAEPKEEGEAKPYGSREMARAHWLANPSPLLEPYLRGLLALAEGDKGKALELLARVAEAQPGSLELQLTLAQLFLDLKQWADAERAFTQVLAVDPQQARAHLGLAQCCLAQRRNLDAVAHALDAVEMAHHFPMGHFTLGVALHRVGNIQEAVAALQLALRQSPNHIAAHERLAYIYKHRLNDPTRSAHHRDTAQQLRLHRGAIQPQIDRTLAERPAPPRPSTSTAAVHLSSIAHTDESLAVPPAQRITIVAGLPRSGTSMMMQMLAAGGLPPLTDGKRTADEDNPRGYFEFEPATKLITNKAWLPQARGKVVKIVAQLLPHLPPNLPYQVVFLQRELDEVLRSQRVMLERNGRDGAALDTTRLGATFSRQLQQVQRWLTQHHVPCLVVPYRDALAEPSRVAGDLLGFLGDTLDAAAMIDAVRPELNRQGAPNGLRTSK